MVITSLVSRLLNWLMAPEIGLDVDVTGDDNFNLIILKHASLSQVYNIE